MKNANIIIEVSIFNTYHDYFDYLIPKHLETQNLKVGMRVKVPLRNKHCIGIIINIKTHSHIKPEKLKHAHTLIDEAPLLNPKLLKICQWASNYYHHPLSHVIQTALPRLLRLGNPAASQQQTLWLLANDTAAVNTSQFKLTPKQTETINLLNKHPEGIPNQVLLQAGIKSNTLQSLHKRGLIISKSRDFNFHSEYTKTHKHPLNDEQLKAFKTIKENIDRFNCFLLHGITGSGKTEIYLQCAEEIIKHNKQVLILVPEIGLTPQIYKHFQARLQVPIALLHSNLTDRQRLDAYLLASSGIAPIIIGTRSAIFTPTINLAMIIVDEEHDPSFKQQEGLRYSARDLAIVRASIENVPIVLGSATPSLESLYNVQCNKYQLLKLNQRTAQSQKSLFKLVDIRNQRLEQGISKPLLNSIHKHLAGNNQVLLFINRRGYAPILMCHQCGWLTPCPNCDSYLTFHWQENYLLCHHCLYKQYQPKFCPTCQSSQFVHVGVGTERIEHVLKQHFPNIPILRFDRDNIKAKMGLIDMFKEIENGGAKILIGTQMLTKGHHFPDLTLVGILNADSAFFSQEFHASERLGQLLIQVAGRAGRAEKQGEVIIQTRVPHHPLLNKLLEQGYSSYSKTLLHERYQGELPPYTSLALFRSEAAVKDKSLQILQEIKRLMCDFANPQLRILGPIPAPMEKRKRLFHAQLLIQSKSRSALVQMLKQLRFELFSLKKNNQVKWSLEIDPIEMF